MSTPPQPVHGRYEVISSVARGGMAELVLARQSGREGFERVVALKRILPEFASNAEFVEMFLDEARIAAKLTHPNIVQIYDLGFEENEYFIAMEYVPGRDVARVLHKARRLGVPVPAPYVARIMAEVCEGLHYAHAYSDLGGKPLNIIHRDISPQNILVGFDGSVKLVDFGIAKASVQLAHTQAGTLKGKCMYMSPEQARGQRLTLRSDIFALGSVMYEMLTGDPPFVGRTASDVLEAIVGAKPLDPSHVNPDVPQELVRVLSRALEKDPARRYPSAQHMQIALETYLKGAGTGVGRIRMARFMEELFGDENADAPNSLPVAGGGTVLVPTGAGGGTDVTVQDLSSSLVRSILDDMEGPPATERDTFQTYLPPAHADEEPAAVVERWSPEGGTPERGSPTYSTHTDPSTPPLMQEVVTSPGAVDAAAPLPDAQAPAATPAPPPVAQVPVRPEPVVASPAPNAGPTRGLGVGTWLLITGGFFLAALSGWALHAWLGPAGN